MKFHGYSILLKQFFLLKIKKKGKYLLIERLLVPEGYINHISVFIFIITSFLEDHITEFTVTVIIIKDQY